jgi:P-type Ca2+ transporter type 2C
MQPALATQPPRPEERAGEQPIFTLPADQVYQRLGSSPTGLTEQEAVARLARYGPNELEEARKTSLAGILLANLFHFFAILLWIAAILSLIGGSPTVAIAIVAVIVINAVFAFWQEFKAEQAVEALRQLLPRRAHVEREGQERIIEARELVPGDVVLLNEGDAISADCRLVEAYRLSTDNSTLTGESMPVPRTADPLPDPSASVLEVPNLVFAGTAAATGTARAVVYATGMRTEFGRIAGLTQSVQAESSPLQRQLERTSRVIAILSVVEGIIFFMLGLFLVHMPVVAVFIFAVGVLVANVPEGMLPTLTLSLAVGTQRMVQRHALVKKLSSVETLGSTTVICTDKTGTLTQNEMTVRRMWVGGVGVEVTGVGYEPKGDLLGPEGPVTPAGFRPLRELLRAAVLANNARVLPPSEDRRGWSVLGDPTEAALLVAAQKAGIDYMQASLDSPRLFEIPFESSRRRMSTINQEGNRIVAYVKGAPREVLSLCTHILTGDGVMPFTPELAARVGEENDRYARDGLRVLAVASREITSPREEWSAETVERDLTLLGLMAMMDPPRPQVADAVRQAHSAGIRLVMVTGDYGLTAESIARKIGMIETERPRIVTGAELEQLSDADLRFALQRGEILFARVAPEQKMRIVGAFKDLGETVAVTGDGVNDAPALKRADIGVAMGITGTDVAKEAAELVLTDDNFATIIAAVEQGRAVYDNIKKFLSYFISANAAELVPFVAMVMFGIPLPLTVLQLLAIDLGAEQLPALALGTERPEPGVMDRSPAAQREPILGRSVLFRGYFFLGSIVAFAGMAGFFFSYWINGWRPGLPLAASGPLYATATTMTLACIVAAQMGNAFASRTSRVSVFQIGLFSNRLLLIGVLVAIVLLAVLIYLPWLQPIFNTAPLGWRELLFLLIWPPVVLLADELRKWYIRRREATDENSDRWLRAGGS